MSRATTSKLRIESRDVSHDQDPSRTPLPAAHRILSLIKSTAGIAYKHASKHTGVGIICSVAYFDPGNWGVDLQAGSEFGYKLLFVVLLSGLFAIYMQVLASRLGCVTGLDLASHCRLLLYNRPRHTLLWRWLVLYPLYVLSEVAIISTDLAELLGSAIALCVLFPKLPLWAGVLVTSVDVLVLLALRDPLQGQPVRIFEVLIAILVFTVLICMAVIISKAKVHWGNAFDGFVPSSTLIESGGLYASIGILGATVMPHSLFLGSAFATQDRLSSMNDLNDALDAPPLRETAEVEVAPTTATSRLCQLRAVVRAAVQSLREQFLPASLGAGIPNSHTERDNHSLAFVRAHIYHGIADMVISLLGLAVVINSLIVILASATFYSPNQSYSATLFDTYDILQEKLGKAVAILFALALLASGQSSSIVATLAGQTVSEGFIRWRLSPMMRRLLTRCLGLIPSMVVASAFGRAGISTLLVVSQVVLSVVLPFVVFPLLWLTSSKAIMSVKKPPADPPTVVAPAVSDGAPSAGLPSELKQVDSDFGAKHDVEAVMNEVVEEVVDFSNGKFTICLGYAIFLLIVIADVYMIVTLAMGEGN